MRKVGRRSVAPIVRTVPVSGAMRRGMGPDLVRELVHRFLTIDAGERQGRHVLVQPAGPPVRDSAEVDDDWLTDRTTHRLRQLWLVAFVGRPRRFPRRAPGHHRPHRR